MEGRDPKQRARRTGEKSGRRRYWTGFTACLFIVLLSVFTWVVHRRLAQYESLQNSGGHHMTATKVCLTDRNQTAMASTQRAQAPGAGRAVFAAVVVLAGALLSDGSGKAAFVRERPRSLHRTRSQPCLAYFFFLPPPGAQLSL